MTTLLLLAALIQPVHADTAAPRTFGAAPTLTEAMPLAVALAEPEKFKDQEILVEGTVQSSCKKKGCWMILTDGEKQVRITFKDYGFFIPKDSIGKKVRAQGVVFRETQSVKTVRHFMKDAGVPAAEIKKVKAPVETVSFTASGVVFLD